MSQLAELRKAFDNAKAEADGYAADLNEMREKTGPAFDQQKHTELFHKFNSAEMERKRLASRIEEMENSAHSKSQHELKSDIEASPTARFLKSALTNGDGNQGLEGWEIDEQKDLRASSNFNGLVRNSDFIIPVYKTGVVTTASTSTIATDTMGRLVERLKDYGGARKMSQVISTAGGNPLEVPKVDETAAIGELVATQGTNANDGGLANSGMVTLNAYTFSSKFIDLSKESITDNEANGFDLIAYAVRQATRRLGRITNQMFTTGSGSSQPEGFWAKAAVGHTTAAGGGADYVSYKDLVEMIMSVDEAYLEGMEEGEGGSMGEMGGRVGWTFHRNFLASLMKLVDGDGRSLWAPGLTSVGADPRQSTILGYPYELNYSANANMAKNQRVAIFGNLSYHVIRDVDRIVIRAFDDSGTAINNTVRILGFARADSRYIGNGTSAEEFKALMTRNADAG